MRKSGRLQKQLLSNLGRARTSVCPTKQFTRYSLLGTHTSRGAATFLSPARERWVAADQNIRVRFSGRHGLRSGILCAIAGLLLCAIALADNIPDLLAQGRADDVIAQSQARINANSKDAEAQNFLCRAYFQLRDWDRGVSACEKAVDLNGNNSQYHLWLARIYGEKADASGFFTGARLVGKVRNEFEAAVRLAPNDPVAVTDLAEFYLEAPGIVGGGRDKAAAQSEILAKLDPAKAHWVNGRIAEKKKDPAAAEKEYRAAIEASHGSAQAWLNLALFFRHNSRWNEMEEAIQHVATAEGAHSEAFVDGAEILSRANRNTALAITLLRRYLASGAMSEQAPAFKAHFLLGTLLEKQGDRPAAVQEYKAALALARNYSPAQEALKRQK